ncbi:phosphohydrolase [Hahella sp. SMD15-11]|uniref:Phosphohydrolase n=1 Tax=Thermohahella caldifontis TaxID=3142973 RepID=A0AB39UY68_9GAMM
MTTHSDLLTLLDVSDRLIMDPVHGGIPLFAHEVRIIDHPWFQRLRFICQNDILSYVFPGATHSRFLHSIGTAHVGGRLFLGLMETSLDRARHQTSLPDQGELTRAIAYLYRVVRLACLLHDCGHSSFSHQFERTPSLRRWLDLPDVRQYVQGNIPHPVDPDGAIEHEHFSLAIASHLCSETGVERDGIVPGDVLSLMDKSEIRPSSRFREATEVLWPVLTLSDRSTADPDKLARVLSGIVSSEMDADRADYLMRDGFHASVTVGGFNLDHLAKNLYIGWEPESGWLGIAVSRKGLGALEDFVYSRYQMYRKVYGHKTSIGFDWLLRQAIEEVLQEPACRDEVRAALTDLEAYCQLTDNYFWEAFRRHARTRPNSFCAMMMRRQRLQHVLTLQNGGSQFTDVRTDLAREYGVPPSRIIFCSLPIRFTRINAGFDLIKYGHRNQFKSRGRTGYQPLVQASDFFQKFEDRQLTHFYLLPEEAPDPLL